jgi:predicted nucleotidyltransferase
MTSDPLPPPTSERHGPAARADAALGEDVVRLLRRVLRDDVLGVYLHGSAVLAGLRRTSDFDVLAVAVARRGGAPLDGPPPREVLDAVPHDDVVRAMLAGVPELLAVLPWDARNVLLTLARIWTTLATGDIRSKGAAAEWVLPRLPEQHRPVLERARAIYVGDGEARWEGLEAAIRPHADHVADVIQGLARRRPV